MGWMETPACLEFSGFFLIAELEKGERKERKEKKRKRQEGEFEKQSRVLLNSILIYLKDMQGDMIHEVMTMRKYNNRQT